MDKIVKFPHTKSALIDTLARKAGRFEEDDPKIAMHFYKQIALLMAHDIIAMNKKVTTLRSLNHLMYVKAKSSNRS